MIRLFIGVALMILSSGCSPLIIPTSYHVPDLREKGDAELGFIGGVATYNGQAAYSPFNNIAVTSTINYNNPGYPDSHSNKHITFGLGGYSGGSGVVQFSIYGRYGFGSATDRNYTDSTHTAAHTNTTDIRFNDLQVQPQINFAGEHFEFYLGFRLSFTQTNYFFTNDDSRISPGDPTIFEPFMGFRVGARHLKLEEQLGIYSHNNTHVSGVPIDAVPNFNIGIVYTFNINKKTFGIFDR